MLYRTGAPFAKMSPPGVEILASGQQLVAFGTHPGNRKPYWLDDMPLDVPLVALPAGWPAHVRGPAGGGPLAPTASRTCSPSSAAAFDGVKMEARHRVTIVGAGLFAEWQPRYAEIGIATFPVRGKRPAVRGYLRVGPAASRKLAEKYGEATAFGLALKPSGIVVVDVDTPDERTLADVLDRHGQTPFIVRSGSGNFQAWYQRQDEGRRIRPDPDVPVDILGGGFVVAPPSSGPRGPYEIIQGTLADLAGLPLLQNATAPKRGTATVSEGRRNCSATIWVI